MKAGSYSAKSCGGFALLSFAFSQRFVQDSPIAGSQGNPGERAKRGSDIGGGGGREVFARLNSVTHQQDGHVLVIVVGSAVTGRIAAGFAGGGAIEEPVGFGHDEQVAASAREKTELHGVARLKEAVAATIQVLGAIHGRDSRGGLRSIHDRA